MKHQPITCDRHAIQLAEAEAIATAAVAYVHELRSTGGYHSIQAMHDMLALCEAVIDHIDDGDCLAQAESLRDELRIETDPMQTQFVERISPSVFGASR